MPVFLAFVRGHDALEIGSTMLVTGVAQLAVAPIDLALVADLLGEPVDEPLLGRRVRLRRRVGEHAVEGRRHLLGFRRVLDLDDVPPHRTRLGLGVPVLVVAGALLGLGKFAETEKCASEGLQTGLIESFAPGGQAGTSSKIENYLGFPAGVTGADHDGRLAVHLRYGVSRWGQCGLSSAMSL